jgi:hypothetical protein
VHYASEKSHAKVKADDDGTPEIQWNRNPDWTFTLIEYLGDNVGFY